MDWDVYYALLPSPKVYSYELTQLPQLKIFLKSKWFKKAMLSKC